ncbi:MAG: hypothetical protein U9O98_03170 [Asgard group archaeon]|nr:hypothetical protein [Asgard group archaeon]
MVAGIVHQIAPAVEIISVAYEINNHNETMYKRFLDWLEGNKNKKTKQVTFITDFS